MNTTPHAIITTEPALAAAIHRHVALSLSLMSRKARQQRELAKLQAAHAEANRAEEEEMLTLFAGIRQYCQAHRADLLPDEAKRKCRDFGSAVIGFRTHPPAVGRLPDAGSWDEVAERLRGLPWGKACVKTVHTVDRDHLLRQREQFTAEQLASAGLRIGQGESFYLEPKAELLPAERKPLETPAAAA